MCHLISSGISLRLLTHFSLPHNFCCSWEKMQFIVTFWYVFLEKKTPDLFDLYNHFSSTVHPASNFNSVKRETEFVSWHISESAEKKYPSEVWRSHDPWYDQLFGGELGFSCVAARKRPVVFLWSSGDSWRRNNEALFAWVLPYVLLSLYALKNSHCVMIFA